MLSRAPEIKRAIYTELAAALDGNGDVTVHLGTPPPETNQYEYVIVGPEDTPMTVDQEWRGFGAGASRTERIDVPVLIEVFKDGEQQTEAEDRSWEIADEVATLLADRTTFDPTVFSAIPSSLSQVTRAFSNGRTSVITLTVHCVAVTRGI